MNKRPRGATGLYMCPLCRTIGKGRLVCHCWDEPVLMGMVTTANGTYIFRNDHGHGDMFWAWEIHDDYTRGMTHKWNKLPKGVIVLFDLDNPPATVGYLPILG